MLKEKFNISNPQIKEVRVFSHLVALTSSGDSYLEILRKIAINSLVEQELNSKGESSPESLISPLEHYNSRFRA